MEPSTEIDKHTVGPDIIDSEVKQAILALKIGKAEGCNKVKTKMITNVNENTLKDLTRL